jgi:16S rRNA (guanine(966)-N(2))-methyltransferase RsmD
MRVIAGTYRGRILRTVEGADVRPTSDRLRETLFNILAPRMRGSRFLDLCAGSGAVGIEALSRGASEVVFIESSRRACLVIEANLRMLSLDDGVRLICRDARAALTQLAETSAQFDIVFFDPPYASGLYDDVLNKLAASTVVLPGSIVIVEHRAKDRVAPAYSNLELYRQVKQGESLLSFYELYDAHTSDL